MTDLAEASAPTPSPSASESSRRGGPVRHGIGALIFFTPRELYPIYSICGRAFTWISPIRDQQIGGLLLWIPGSMMSVFGALIALRHWMRLSARERLIEERRREAPAATRPPAPVQAH